MQGACSFCGNTEFKSKSVEYVYRRGEKMLVVNGVPCTQCTYCGERYYEAEVLSKIESDFEAIENGTREVEKHLSVPVEDFSRLVG
ncbi:MAG: type II toxin-antitoxin system MqsA family antitoxin [Spirochaetaceae bacterium]|nr:MAG: type II toxin-antitoxin system MqsA family antitoxin [Spirochaetaceae bacterium]